MQNFLSVKNFFYLSITEIVKCFPWEDTAKEKETLWGQGAGLLWMEYASAHFLSSWWIDSIAIKTSSETHFEKKISPEDEEG